MWCNYCYGHERSNSFFVNTDITLLKHFTLMLDLCLLNWFDRIIVMSVEIMWGIYRIFFLDTRFLLLILEKNLTCFWQIYFNLKLSTFLISVKSSPRSSTKYGLNLSFMYLWCCLECHKLKSNLLSKRYNGTELMFLLKRGLSRLFKKAFFYFKM